jgi:hypothetical protein
LLLVVEKAEEDGGGTAEKEVEASKVGVLA